MTITKEENLAIGEIEMYIEAESAKYIPDYNLSFVDDPDEFVPCFYIGKNALPTTVARWAYETQMKIHALQTTSDGHIHFHCDDGDFMFKVTKDGNSGEIEYPTRKETADAYAMAIPEFIAYAKMCKFLNDKLEQFEAEEKAKAEKKQKAEESASRKRAEAAMKILERFKKSA